MEFQFVSIALCPFTRHPWKVWLSSFPQLFIRIDKTQYKSSLLQAEEFQAESLSLKSVCKPLLIFVALHCTYSSMSMPFLHWGSRTGWSTTNVAFPGLKTRITTLNLLAMLFLTPTQYTDGLNFWKGTFAGSCSTCYLQNPQVIYHKAAFQTVGPQPLLVHGVILPQV